MDLDNRIYLLEEEKSEKFLKLEENNKYILNINFKNITKDQYKHIIKKVCRKKKKIGITRKGNSKIFLGYISNYNSNDKEEKQLIQGINAIFYNDIKKMYNYIYDAVCEYLDNEFYDKNLCEFKNNKCIEKKNTSSITGCCHHLEKKFLGPFRLNNKFVQCEYLKKGICTAKCISCKLFTCTSLRKKGIKFKINDFLLLDTFFGIYQKYIIKTTVFTPKEKIVEKLIKCPIKVFF